MMKINIKLLFVFLILAACDVMPPETTIRHYGTLKGVMMDRAIAATVDLDTMLTANLYGIGVMDSLKGEITILDGKIYGAEIKDSLAVEIRRDKLKASLLIFDYIKKWQAIEINDFKEPASTLAKIQQDYGLPAAFPFMLTAKPAQLYYHIIGMPDAEASAEEHLSNALKDVLKKREVKILGFFALDKKGIITHKNEDIHMHFVELSSKLTGHIDVLMMGNDSVTLLIPEI